MMMRAIRRVNQFLEVHHSTVACVGFLFVWLSVKYEDSTPIAVSVFFKLASLTVASLGFWYFLGAADRAHKKTEVRLIEVEDSALAEEAASRLIRHRLLVQVQVLGYDGGCLNMVGVKDSPGPCPSVKKPLCPYCEARFLGEESLRGTSKQALANYKKQFGDLFGARKEGVE